MNQHEFMDQAAASSKLHAIQMDQAIRLLRSHDDEDKCAADCCGCMGYDLPELIENLKDDHTKAAGELRRLKKAVAESGLDIGYTVDGGIVLLAKGTVPG